MRARFALILLISTAFVAPAAAKPGTPGPAYFAGLYQMIGQTGSTPPVLISTLAQITPQGRDVAITTCTGAPIVMGFGPAHEVVHLMTGAQAGRDMDCLFHNNGYNRPILTCEGADGARFTLWPIGTDVLQC